MRARTHTEIYRPYRGTIRDSAARALTLAWSGVRVGFKRKLPMLFLFAIPLISTIVGAFQIQLKFDALSKELSFVPADSADLQAQMANQLVVAGLAELLGSVEQVILSTLGTLQFFVVLAMGWYGAGLIAEDKRLRANLLYFARPITRWTYLRGKLGTVLFWGGCVVVVPVTIMCGTAVFASPDWSFLTDRWPVILKLEAYALLWVAVHALLVLAISSVCRLRNQALAGLFGVYFLTSIAAELLAWLFDSANWRLLSVVRNFERLSEELFGISSGEVTWGLEASLWALAAFCGLCLTILNAQIKKLELGR